MGLENIIQQLQEEAYTYYPKGILDSEPQYYLSSAYLNLQQTKKEKINLMLNSWLQLVEDINHQSDGFNIQVEDWKETLHVDNCFKLVIIDKSTAKKLEDCIRLVLNLSLLIPYYWVHQSLWTPESKIVHKGNYQSVSYNIPTEVAALYDTLVNLIDNHFPSYQAIHPEILFTSIEDIMFEGHGQIQGLLSNDNKRMNIFSAFFSNNYL